MFHLKCTNLEYKSHGKKIKIYQTRLHIPSLAFLSLSLPPLPRRLGPINAGLTCRLSPTPFILRVPPGSYRGWTLAGKGTFENYMEPQKQRVAPKKSWEQTRHYHTTQQLCFWNYESVRVWKSYVWHFETPWTIACQAPLSLEFLRQEYCRELPFLSPGDLCNS